MWSRDNASGYLYTCPCCGFPTLGDRGGFEICVVCFWEDDGQDAHNADKVLGGPNSDYSLTESRKNFEQHFTCYRPGDVRAFEASAARIAWAKEVAPRLEELRWKGRVRLTKHIEEILASQPK
jgi:hypothetical protein